MKFLVVLVILIFGTTSHGAEPLAPAVLGYLFTNGSPPDVGAGNVLVMVGTESCSASRALRPVIVEHLGLPGTVKFAYLDRAELTAEAKYLPTPFLFLFKDGRVVDFHVGLVGPQNSFAKDANHKIAEHLLVRNGLKQGDRWALAVNHPDEDLHGSFDYQALKFYDLRGRSLEGASFKHSVLSGVRLEGAVLTGAKFHNTIFAHVDLRGAKLDPSAVDQITWVAATCPNGTVVSGGRSCSGHLNIQPTAPVRPMPAARP